MTIERPRARNFPTRGKALTPGHRAPWFFMAFVAVFCVTAVAGCGNEEAPRGLTKQAVAIEEVPDALLKAARKEVPDVNLNEAWKNLDGSGKLHSYEIRGKNASDGKIREVRVSTTGEILEKE